MKQDVAAFNVRLHSHRTPGTSCAQTTLSPWRIGGDIKLNSEVCVYQAGKTRS